MNYRQKIAMPTLLICATALLPAVSGSVYAQTKFGAAGWSHEIKGYDSVGVDYAGSDRATLFVVENGALTDQVIAQKIESEIGRSLDDLPLIEVIGLMANARKEAGLPEDPSSEAMAGYLHGYHQNGSIQLSRDHFSKPQARTLEMVEDGYYHLGYPRLYFNGSSIIAKWHLLSDGDDGRLFIEHFEIADNAPVLTDVWDLGKTSYPLRRMNFICVFEEGKLWLEFNRAYANFPEYRVEHWVEYYEDGVLKGTLPVSVAPSSWTDSGIYRIVSDKIHHTTYSGETTELNLAVPALPEEVYTGNTIYGMNVRFFCDGEFALQVGFHNRSSEEPVLYISQSTPTELTSGHYRMKDLGELGEEISKRPLLGHLFVDRTRDHPILISRDHMGWFEVAVTEAGLDIKDETPELLHLHLRAAAPYIWPITILD